MPGIDPTIALGAKAPDPMQNLSGLLSVANGAQTFRQNQQKTQQGSIDLQERQGVQSVLADPSNYTDQDGNIDFSRALPAVMRVAPTTGMRYVQDLMTAQKQQVDAKQSLNNLATDVRTQAGKVLYGMPADTPPDVFNQTVDALNRQYKGADPYFNLLKNGYSHALQQGKGPDFIANAAKTTMPPQTQQTMATPEGPQVDNGQQVISVNTRPGVPGYPQGSQVFSVQKQLPPTTPTVGPNNQPGYVGSQNPPTVGTVPNTPQPDNDQAAIYRQELAKAQDKLANPQKYMSPAEVQADPTGAQFRSRTQQDVLGIQREMARLHIQAQGAPQGAQSAGFVPSGPVPGANESKAGSVQVVNDHWNKINAGAADAPVASALLSTIKQLAPGAITGTEAGKRAYWNGLFNALGVGDKATGDIQKDTDLLNKSMAQLNLNTPATTDAMRTLIEAGRPHSTMSAAAIKEAAGQIEGQLKANMAMRNMLAPDKRYADATGDLSHYQQKMQTLQDVIDPRIFQYEGLAKEDRRAFMARLAPQDRAALIAKTKKLEALGVFQ